MKKVFPSTEKDPSFHFCSDSYPLSLLKDFALSVIHSLSFNTDATKYTGILHIAYKYALASSI